MSRPPNTDDRPDPDEGFLARWSRRKSGVDREAARPVAPPPVALAEPGPVAAARPPATDLPDPTGATAGQAVQTPAAEPEEPAAPPAPTLDEARALTAGSDITRFVKPGVDPAVRNTALRRLFADPHFNAMDGLDVYIDDYGKPDPLPAAWLAKVAQRAYLNLGRDDDEAEVDADRAPPSSAKLPAEPGDPGAPTPSTTITASHEDPDLRLQPDDAAGPHGAGAGAREDPGRER